MNVFFFLPRKLLTIKTFRRLLTGQNFAQTSENAKKNLVIRIYTYTFYFTYTDTEDRVQAGQSDTRILGGNFLFPSHIASCWTDSKIISHTLEMTTICIKHTSNFHFFVSNRHYIEVFAVFLHWHLFFWTPSYLRFLTWQMCQKNEKQRCKYLHACKRSSQCDLQSGKQSKVKL